MRQLREVDHQHGWEDNWTALAIIKWCRPPRGRRREAPDAWFGDGYDWRGNWEDPRAVIEIALSEVSRKARRELRRLVTQADQRRQAMWLRNPFAPTDLPWWLRNFDY